MRKKRFQKQDIDRVCREAAGLLKSLAHPQRLRLLSCLAESEHTVGELQRACGASQSIVSQFLGRMKREGWIQSRKEGQRVWYQIKDQRVARVVRTIQKVFCAGVLLAVSISSKADTSLGEVVEAIAARHSETKAAEAQVRSARWALSDARAGRWPRLDWRSSWTRSDQPVFVFGSLLGQESFGAGNFAIDALNRPSLWSDFRNSLDVGVPLLTGGELTFRQKTAREQLKTAEIQSEGARQGVRFRAVEGVLLLLKAQETQRMWENRVAEAAKEVESAQALRKKGLVLGSDYFAAEALLSSFRAQLVDARKNVQAARDSLALLLGTPRFETSVKGFLTSARYDLLPLDHYLQRALAERPDVLGARGALAQVQGAEEQSKRGGWPRVEAFASLETHTRDFARNPSQQMVGVRSQVAFVDVSRRAREHAAQEDLLRWTYLKESTEDQARQEVTAAYHTLQGALEQMPWVQQGVVQAKTSLDLFRPLYREGRQSLLDVVKAEDALARMESQRTELLYGVHRGYAHLMRVIGGLDSTALRRIQSELEVHP